MYEMFMGPLEKSKPWSTKGLEGMYRFLKRVWRLIVDEDGGLSAFVSEDPSDEKIDYLIHETTKKVTEDIENLRFNTAISQLMICSNDLNDSVKRNKKLLKNFVLLLSPFAPHMCEELWNRLGGIKTLAYEKWPEYDENKLVKAECKIPVQINGKVRDNIKIPVDCNQEAVMKVVEQSDKVQKYLVDQQIKKIILVPNKILNIVI